MTPPARGDDARDAESPPLPTRALAGSRRANPLFAVVLAAIAIGIFIFVIGLMVILHDPSIYHVAHV